MNRTKSKKQRVGYSLRINRTGENGAGNWEMVGTVFGSRYLAHKFKDRYYPNIPRYTIQGVRVSTWKIDANTKPAVDAAKEL